MLEGRSHLHARRERGEAVRLLSRARDLEPTNFEVGFDLSRLYWKTRARAASVDLLDELELFATRPQRVRVRRAHFFRYPNLSTAWRWLRAWAWGR